MAVLEKQGIAIRAYSLGSPANVDSFHLDAKFKDGGLTAKTGAYWHSERGAWITGETAVDWVAALLHLRARARYPDVPKMSKALLVAYRRTDYVVLHQPEVVIRIGATSERVQDLLATHGAKSATVITAYNPFSKQLASSENARRNEQLFGDIRAKSLSLLPAEGQDPQGRWPPEASFFVFDASTRALNGWLTKFQQHAAVRVQRRGPATLILHPAHR